MPRGLALSAIEEADDMASGVVRPAVYEPVRSKPESLPKPSHIPAGVTGIPSHESAGLTPPARGVAYIVQRLSLSASPTRHGQWTAADARHSPQSSAIVWFRQS